MCSCFLLPYPYILFMCRFASLNISYYNLLVYKCLLRLDLSLQGLNGCLDVFQKKNYNFYGYKFRISQVIHDDLVEFSLSIQIMTSSVGHCFKTRTGWRVDPSLFLVPSPFGSIFYCCFSLLSC